MRLNLGCFFFSFYHFFFKSIKMTRAFFRRARAAKHAERREQAEIRLWQLACKMAKVLRWKRAQEVWTAWMRDKTASAPAPNLAQPAAPAPLSSSPRRASAAAAAQQP